jgi:hypothetical protein
MERETEAEATALSFTQRVARNVAEAIDSEGRKLVWLSERTQINSTTLNRRLSGESPFNTAELDAIATALRIPISVLLAGPIGVSA